MTLSTSFSAGQRLTAAELTTLVTAIQGLQVPNMCVAYRAAAQSIPHAVGTTLQLDSQSVDTAAMFSPTDDKIYAVTTGVHLVTGFALCSGPNFMILDLLLNGANIATQAAPTDASGVVRICAATHVYMTSGQYVSASLYQSSTGSVARNATGRMTLAYRGAIA